MKQRTDNFPKAKPGARCTSCPHSRSNHYSPATIVFCNKCNMECSGEFQHKKQKKQKRHVQEKVNEDSLKHPDKYISMCRTCLHPERLHEEAGCGRCHKVCTEGFEPIEIQKKKEKQPIPSNYVGKTKTARRTSICVTCSCWCYPGTDIVTGTWGTMHAHCQKNYQINSECLSKANVE